MYNVVARASNKHQAADAHSALPKKGIDATTRFGEVPVLTVIDDQFLPENTDEGIVGSCDENNGGAFVPFLSEVLALSDKLSAGEIETKLLKESCTPQSTGP